MKNIFLPFSIFFFFWRSDFVVVLSSLLYDKVKWKNNSRSGFRVDDKSARLKVILNNVL